MLKKTIKDRAYLEKKVGYYLGKLQQLAKTPREEQTPQQKEKFQYYNQFLYVVRNTLYMVSGLTMIVLDGTKEGDCKVEFMDLKDESKEFIVYITTGGIMEQPEWRDKYHRTIKAKDADCAVAKWAKETKHYTKDLVQKSPGNWTYWGWGITVKEVTRKVRGENITTKEELNNIIKALEWYEGYIGSDKTEMADTIVKLFKNHERLRGALEEIYKCYETGVGSRGRMIDVARKALEGKDDF